jgi:hypothetical protein
MPQPLPSATQTFEVPGLGTLTAKITWSKWSAHQRNLLTIQEQYATERAQPDANAAVSANREGLAVDDEAFRFLAECVTGWDREASYSPDALAEELHPKAFMALLEQFRRLADIPETIVARGPQGEADASGSSSASNGPEATP